MFMPKTVLQSLAIYNQPLGIKFKCEFKTKDKRLTMPKSNRFLSCKTLEKKAFLKVLLYTMQSLVSIFKTAKPSSLVLDHSGKGLLEKVKKSAIKS